MTIAWDKIGNALAAYGHIQGDPRAIATGTALATPAPTAGTGVPTTFQTGAAQVTVRPAPTPAPTPAAAPALAGGVGIALIALAAILLLR